MVNQLWSKPSLLCIFCQRMYSCYEVPSKVLDRRQVHIQMRHFQKISEKFAEFCCVPSCMFMWLKVTDILFLNLIFQLLLLTIQPELALLSHLIMNNPHSLHIGLRMHCQYQNPTTAQWLIIHLLPLALLREAYDQLIIEQCNIHIFKWPWEILCNKVLNMIFLWPREN